MNNADRDEVIEPALDPARPIIDAHHHLWAVSPNPTFQSYEAEAMVADIRESGQNVVATVYVDSRSNYRVEGPEHLRYAGETAFADGIADACLHDGPGAPRLCAAIVGRAELERPELKELLEAHIAASPGRFKGIRQRLANDPDNPFNEPAGLMAREDFRAGLRLLGSMGLGFETSIVHPQIAELAALARSAPGTRIIVNHNGGLMMTGRFVGRETEAFDAWSAALADLATCPNVTLKIGGMNLEHSGLSFVGADHLPSSEEVAARQGAFALRVIDLFGPDRCMLESNFPVDRLGISYGVLWNAFKRVTARFAPHERHALFFGTANRVYGLGLG